MNKSSEDVPCSAFWDRGQVKLKTKDGKPYVIEHITQELDEIVPKYVILEGKLIDQSSQPVFVVNDMTLPRAPDFSKEQRYKYLSNLLGCFLEGEESDPIKLEEVKF